MSDKLLSIKDLELSFKMYEGTLNVLKAAKLLNDFPINLCLNFNELKMLINSFPALIML